MAHAGRTRLCPVTFSFYWLVVLWSPLGDTVVDPHVAASPLADPIRCPAARTAKGDNHARDFPCLVTGVAGEDSPSRACPQAGPRHPASAHRAGSRPWATPSYVPGSGLVTTSP